MHFEIKVTWSISHWSINILIISCVLLPQGKNCFLRGCHHHVWCFVLNTLTFSQKSSVAVWLNKQQKNKTKQFSAFSFKYLKRNVYFQSFSLSATPHVTKSSALWDLATLGYVRVRKILKKTWSIRQLKLKWLDKVSLRKVFVFCSQMKCLLPTSS